MTQKKKSPRRLGSARGQKTTQARRASENNIHPRPAIDPTDWCQVAKARYPRANIMAYGRFAVVNIEFPDAQITLHKTREQAEEEKLGLECGGYDGPSDALRLWIRMQSPPYEIVDLAEPPKKSEG